MERCTVGILAHVDAGKTTLSEAMLYESGNLRRLGRVDHGDAFLDTDALERERGITIFSKQAILPLQGKQLTLLDTPGHVDFSTEMERTLQVLDAAILVISGTDGIQGHTRTLWQLLARHQIPTFLFINKMDLPGRGHDALLQELQALDGRCMDFSVPQQERDEAVALCDETLLSEYLEQGGVSDKTLAEAIRQRRIFPCFFGSALHLQGVDELLAALERLLPQPVYPAAFGARVFKITHDSQGNRLTHLKITGGSLRVKTLLSGTDREEPWQEKVDQLRLYSGTRFQLAEELEAGAVCAVTGLTHTWPGQGLGMEPQGDKPQLVPVLTYTLNLPPDTDPTVALRRLRELEEEDPLLHLAWNEQLGKIQLQLMGEVQLQVLRERLLEQYHLNADFDSGSIVYRETIANVVEGVGHFEPLRHYAEVHLLLSPAEPGSGITLQTACSEDVLDRNWQRLILTHLAEKQHLGVLTGAPITDVQITLMTGRAHLKHTEGGDFRQATYRAVRQGLMQAESILLEPLYRFTLHIPSANLGRALSDLQRLHAKTEPSETHGDFVTLSGTAPAACLQGYALEVAAYSRGEGHLSCVSDGYAPCHNAEEVCAKAAYEPTKDLENTPDSVFCAHGAGFVVPWNEVAEHMHLPSTLQPVREEPKPKEKKPLLSRPGLDDKELEAIFARTYGAPQRKDWLYNRRERYERLDRQLAVDAPSEEYLLVDGYNILFAWDELAELAAQSIEAAREALLNILSNYQGFRKCALILVFDAYRVPNQQGTVSRFHDLYVVYTKQAETADQYIEKTTYHLAGRRKVRVATSDGIEQLIILGHGAERISARAFHEEVHQVLGQIRTVIQKLHLAPTPTALSQNAALRQKLEALKRSDTAED